MTNINESLLAAWMDDSTLDWFYNELTYYGRDADEIGFSFFALLMMNDEVYDAVTKWTGLDADYRRRVREDLRENAHEFTGCDFVPALKGRAQDYYNQVL